MDRGLSEPWAQAALSPLSEPFSRQLLFSPLVDSAQFFYLFFIYLPPTPCSPGKSERGCGNCAAFHPVDVHLGAFISPTRGTANQPGSTYFVIMGAQSERNEVSGCAARSHRSISSLFCCCPAGDAVHRRLCSPPARGFSAFLNLIDPFCHCEASPGLGRKSSHWDQAVN